MLRIPPILLCKNGIQLSQNLYKILFVQPNLWEQILTDDAITETHAWVVKHYPQLGSSLILFYSHNYSVIYQSINSVEKKKWSKSTCFACSYISNPSSNLWNNWFQTRRTVLDREHNEWTLVLKLRVPFVCWNFSLWLCLLINTLTSIMSNSIDNET